MRCILCKLTDRASTELEHAVPGYCGDSTADGALFELNLGPIANRINQLHRLTGC